MIEPKEIQVVTQRGETRTYIISKFPAIQGREIITQYPLSAVPKVGDYKANEQVMLKLMAFVAVPSGCGELRLTTQALVDNHVPDWETLAKIEVAMIEYNCSFFGNGKASGFFATIEAKARQLISSTLTDLLQQSSQKEKPASTN